MTKTIRIVQPKRLWTVVGGIALSLTSIIGALLGAHPSHVWAGPTDGGSRKRVITIDNGETTRGILTEANTLRQAFTQANIRLDPRDITEPALDDKLVGGSYDVTIYHARPVLIVDGAMRTKVMTPYRTANQIAQTAGLTLYPEDTVDLSRSDNVLSDGVAEKMTITRASEVTQTREEMIDFAVEKVIDTTKPAGYRAVQTPGVKGRKTVTYKVSMQYGAEIGRQVIDTKITQEPTKQIEIMGAGPSKNPLTKSRGVVMFTDSAGIVHRETYYDLPMNVVMSNCGAGGKYSVREDGIKVDKDGYIIIAANLARHPRCSVVETSNGLAKVYDTGGFAAVHPEGYDIATDWTIPNGI